MERCFMCMRTAARFRYLFFQDAKMSNLLKPQLSDAVKAAMRAKDSARLGTLRFLLAAVKQKEVDERRELDDAEINTIIEKQVKKRRESITAFQQACRTETAQTKIGRAHV